MTARNAHGDRIASGSVCPMTTDSGKARLDLVVRPATVEDLEATVDLYVQVGEEGWFIAAEPPIDRHERRLWLEHRLNTPWTLVLVAAVRGEIIGYLTAVGSEREPAEISLGVAQAWRSRGVGRRLVEAAIQWAQGNRVHKLAVEVFPHNHATLALFEHLGFHREGRRRAHYRRRDGAIWDVIVLGLPLEGHAALTDPAASA
jgi:L-amino acid N-acyltransferase YncA